MLMQWMKRGVSNAGLEMRELHNCRKTMQPAWLLSLSKE